MTKPPIEASAGKPGLIKIIGIGQSLRGDDAAGLEAVRLWRERYLARPGNRDIQVELAELPGVGLLSLLEGCAAAILVDSVRSQAVPGTVRLISENELEVLATGSGSAHGWGVAEALALGRQLTPASLPHKLFLVGIEAGQVDPGQPLSPQVEAALPQAIELIERCVGELFGG